MPDKVIIDYTIAESPSAARMMLIVQDLIKKGWVPYGSLLFSGVHYVQAMVLYQ